MSRKRILAQSLESVKHQPNPRLFRDLVEAFTFLRESDHPLTNAARDRSVIKESGVERIVKHYTNLNIRLSVGRGGIRAYVTPPRLDKNHALFSTADRRRLDNMDAVLAIRKAKRSIGGAVDLEQGRVEGVYAELVSDIFVSAELVQEEFFTVEELTAYFLHEVGHLMTYYEYLGRSHLVDHVLGDLTRGYAQATSPKERVELLAVTRDALDLSDFDVDEASGITDTESIQMLIVSEVVNKPAASGTNTRVYDYRTVEAVADQYVSRMGAGRHLATGMDRLFRLAGTTSYYSDRKYLIIESVKVLLIAKWFVGFFVLAALTSPLVDPSLRYDPPAERIKRIRRDLVEAMKNPRIDKDYRKRLQEDADVIADLLRHIKDRETIIGYLWKRLYPPNLKQMNRVKMMQELETLANNELFVKANLLTVKAQGETHA